MKLRTLSTIAAATAITLSVAACGDDTVEQSGSTDTTPTLPEVSVPESEPVPATEAPAPGYEHPTGADEVILDYRELGGFTTPEWAFQRTPSVLVSGDGRVFTPGAQIAIYPGPLLPAIQVQTISEEGIQQILAAADEAGLLAEVEYADNQFIADATTATVTISADGDTWLHEAYALGITPPGEPETPERAALAGFLAALADLPGLVGADALGPAEIYEPEEYEIAAIPVDDLSAYASDGIEPTVVDWPTDAAVPLADAVAPVDGVADGAPCTLVPAAEFGELFASANQLTFFADDGVTYQVLVRPVLPGECAG
jgi:hypothetical protein